MTRNWPMKINLVNEKKKGRYQQGTWQKEKLRQWKKKIWTVTTNWTMPTILDNGNKVGKKRQTGRRRQI